MLYIVHAAANESRQIPLCGAYIWGELPVWRQCLHTVQRLAFLQGMSDRLQHLSVP